MSDLSEREPYTGDELAALRRAKDWPMPTASPGQLIEHGFDQARTFYLAGATREPTEDEVEWALAAFYGKIADTTEGWLADTKGFDAAEAVYRMGNGMFTVGELRAGMAAALTAARSEAVDG